MTLQEKFSAINTPKKILSLDGGGIRGIFTLGILKKIETLLRQKESNAELVLSDYYDLIGGTSTGAIIATGLALGWEVDKIIRLYHGLGSKIFGEGKKLKFLNRESVFRNFVRENYSSKNLENYLIKSFGEIKISDENKIKCGLVINAKRADTYSLWTVSNHPDGKYYEANSDLKLWELCRASSAAPKYFKPKLLKLRTRELMPFDVALIDGGVSLANNPAWQLFLVATIPSFGYRWEAGLEKINIVSIGTGIGTKTEDSFELSNDKAFKWGGRLVNLFGNDALENNDILFSLLGVNIGENKSIDSQFCNLDEVSYDIQKLFKFQRHNVKLDADKINELSDEFNYTQKQAESFRELDYYENMDDLLKIGTAYAEKSIMIDLL
jgi:hypothetical protein